MFMAAFFIPAKTWRQCNCSSIGEWTDHGTVTQWITAQQWKQMFYWYNNLDDSQNNYAQWNRGETELDKVLYDSHCIKFLKTCKLVYSGRKQIRAVWENKAGSEEGLQKGTKLLWDDGYVYNFHCDDGFFGCILMLELIMRFKHVGFMSITASLVPQTSKKLPAMQEMRVWSLDQKDPLEKGIATHSSILAWGIPWTEDPGGLHFMGLTKHQTWLSD